MGLDMYLSAKRYASKYIDKGLATKIAASISDEAPPTAGNLEAIEVATEVAYWRKASAIHTWFVREVQGGKDDCNSYYVTPEDLAKLRDTCLDLLTDRSEARAKLLLPTSKGFFFGPTDYGKYYWEQVEETAEKLKQILEWHNGRGSRWSFSYQSSW